MDWDDLRFLLAAGKASTLTKAAHNLGVNQTTVSRRLNSLQEGLGVRLLERAEQGWAPTKAGEEVLEAAERIDEVVTELSRRVLGLDERLSGDLRITTIDYFAVYEMELFHAFKRRYPGVNLELVTGYATVNLSKREADIALRWTDKPPEHLVGQKIVRAEYALYGAKELIKDLDTNNYNTLPWLGWDAANRARGTELWMKKNAPGAEIVMRFDSALAMVSALKQGVGVTFVPCAYGDADPNLERLRPVEPNFGVDTWALTHADLRSTARVKAFMRHAYQYFQQRKAAYAG